MSTSMQRAARQSWLLYVVVVLVVLAIGVPFVLDHNRATREARIEAASRAQLACIQRWADATADRSAFLQRYLLPRNDAQNDLTIAQANGAPRAEIVRLRDLFIDRSRRYAEVQAANPLPVPPRLLCASAVRKLQDPPAAPSTPARRTSSPTRSPSTSSPETPQPATSTTTTTPPAPRATTTRPGALPRNTATLSASGSTTASRPSPRPTSTPTTAATSSGLLGDVVRDTCTALPLPVLCPPRRSETP